MQPSAILQPLSDHVWHTKYQWSDKGHIHEPSIEATWDRVALAVSSVEVQHKDEWRERFRNILADFRFLPGGRILANAGTHRKATLLNCFAMGAVEDSIQGIFNSLRESMLTLQSGGGVGVDFSTLRPCGARTAASDSLASGPVSFMEVWEAAVRVLETSNQRRSAIMVSLRCDHPDIEAFIEAKMANKALPHLKLSVVVGDDFMRAVAQDSPWPLVFPLGQHPIPSGGEVCERIWSGATVPELCLVHRRLPARVLWTKLQEAQHACDEPGVLFMDRINRDNNLWYCEKIATTNPSGEVPLPPYGTCNLGSINLTRFVRHSFSRHPHLDMGEIRAVAAIATRFLDNVHELSQPPLRSQEKATHANRRLGLGITGLADTFAMLGLRYGSASSLDLVREVMGAIRDTAYQTSIALAQERGSFAMFDKIKYGASPFVLNLPHKLQDAIAQHGIRNSHLLAVAPTDAASLLANNVSSGIAPMFAFKTVQRIRGADDQMVSFDVEDAAVRLYTQVHDPATALPTYFAQAADVSAEDQLRMMATVQPFVDNAIAKTVRLPSSADVQDIGAVLHRAWELGLKGCSVSLLHQ